MVYCVLIRIASMSTNHIHFIDKMKKKILNYSYLFVFLSDRKNFLGTQIERVRIRLVTSHQCSSH